MTKMQLETERIKILPLSAEQLKKYINCDFSLEDELRLKREPRNIQKELKEVINSQILSPVIDGNKNYLFFTLWTVIDKSKNVMVGDMCFKGEADENGAVEIGYGIYPAFQNQGYMKESVNCLVDWALSLENVEKVAAETDSNNFASHHILNFCGFKQLISENNKILWQKSKIRNFNVNV
jgi:[ribosomal protein S5]-alanine N-acetyltransferase